MKWSDQLKVYKERRERIYKLYESGEKSMNKIAEEEGISVTAVSALIKRHEKELQKIK